MIKESENIEFKRELTNSFIKEVIAFANTSGGTIIIGYNDDGTIYGVDNSKNVLEQISNMIHDSIEPQIDYLVSSKIVEEDNKDIIVVDVLEGTNKPYYIKSKGMTDKGVFIRLGSATEQASKDTIKNLIIESSGITFEKNISYNQNLTFEYTTKIFNENNLKFTKIEMQNLGLIAKDEKYTNLGLLLSDECPYTIKMGVYPDNTKNNFLDSKETEQSSILKQIENVESYLKINNKVKSTINDFKREDTYDYDNSVLRECVLNMIAHRDYDIPGSDLIHVFKDYIEFVSLGGLVKGATIDDIKLGHSASRNIGLVSILHRLGYVEAYGTGIPKIYNSYSLCINKPEIKTAPNTFLISIPKIKYSEEYLKIINYLKNNQVITRESVENILNVGKHKAFILLSDLVNNNILIREGSGKNIIYKLK